MDVIYRGQAVNAGRYKTAIPRFLSSDLELNERRIVLLANRFIGAETRAHEIKLKRNRIKAYTCGRNNNFPVFRIRRMLPVEYQVQSRELLLRERICE